MDVEPVELLESPARSVEETGSAASRAYVYADIVKATALIGGSSMVNIAIGLCRTKAMALMLGPAGVGLIGVYSSIADLTQSLAGMGIQSSGVRQIAEAMGSLDTERIARTIAVLRRMAVLLGLVGACVLITFSRPISRFTFGGDRQAISVALLAFVVLFREVSAGQSALIQGMRRIPDLACINVFSAFFATGVGIPIVYLWGVEGIVPSLIAASVVTLLTSSWYSRTVRLQPARLAAPQVRQETTLLLKLGIAFMVSGFLTMGAAYAVRLIVLRRVGVDAAGFYQSAWALGGLYVSFILQAMGADFYPRLTAVAGDNVACNQMVNEQARVSLLLAGPGVTATLTFAPLVIAGFYSAEFGPAVTLLRWICLGMVLRVLAWPMGFIILAKGAQKLLIAAEVAAAIVHVGLALILVSTMGLDGSGAAFFGLYVWHSVLIYVIVHKISGFRWSEENRRLGIVVLSSTALTFVSFYVLPSWLSLAAGLTGTLLTGLYSVRTLLTILPPDSTTRLFLSWLPRLSADTGAVPVD